MPSTYYRYITEYTICNIAHKGREQLWRHMIAIYLVKVVSFIRQ